MKLDSWFWEPQLLGDQSDDPAHHTAWPPENPSQVGNFSVTHVFGSRHRFPIVVSTAMIAVLSALVVVYVCLLPRGMRKSRVPIIRRLSSSGDEDECQDLLDSANSARKERSVGSSYSSGSSEGSGSHNIAVSRKRPYRFNEADDEVEQARKLLREDRQQTASSPQSSYTTLSSPVSTPSSSSNGHDMLGESLLVPQISAEDEKAEGAEISTLTSGDAGYGESDWLEDFVGEPENLEEWFLEYVLDSSPPSPSGFEEDQPDDVIQHDNLEGGKLAYLMTDESMGKEGSIIQESQVTGRNNELGEEASGSVERETSAQLEPNANSPVHPSTSEEVPSEPVPSIDELLLGPGEHQVSDGLERRSTTSAEHFRAPGSSQPSTDTTSPRDIGSYKASPEHPFYRIPRAVHSHYLAPFNFQRAQYFPRLKPLSEILNPIRGLLVMPELHHGELQTLMELAESLVRIAFSTNSRRKAYLPYQLLDPLARNFILVDTLWCICEVVGPRMMKESWWHQFMLRMLDNSAVGDEADLRRQHLASRLYLALEVYASGVRPPAKLVIELKQEIFCSKRCPLTFRNSTYDEWRNDGGC